ncbi:uncharacterized protein LOC119091577 [Pollicipes pollicipes]|uniref:uncharacterized protein LOC119091577 n=1 Tax=Pollicipes pollicipes TaxID=41117 RepID=UPI0018859512|nr:uncharacterized protein LOC119091577 [Pollicipes pollicipes]
MLRVPTGPLRQRSTGDLPSIPEGSPLPPARLGGSRSHGDLDQLQQELPQHNGLHRQDSAEFLFPYLPFAEIPPEKGLRRCKCWLRQVARKARKNILHHSTHDCSIPPDCREQLKHIYVY